MNIEITGIERSESTIFTSVREVLSEWRYGAAIVTAAWPERVSEAITLGVSVSEGDASEASVLAEYFVHDVYLICNIAEPGSFGGVFSIDGAAAFTLDARVFEYARPRSGTVPLAVVAKWFDALNLGTNEAGTPMAKALFHLLHLARMQEDELLSVVRLAEAAAALGITRQKVFDLLRGPIPVVHPVAEADELSLQWIDAADLAVGAVVAEIQKEAIAAAK